MRLWLLLSFSLLLPALGLCQSAPCGGHGDRNSMLVSTAWLAEHLHDPKLVVLAVGNKEDYDKGHIPGSIFLSYMDSHLMKGPTGLTLEMPPMDQLAAFFGKAGVSNDSRIVLYQAKDWFSPTARVYLTLDAMGLAPQTSVLDGGFLLWSKEGRPVSTEETHPAKPGAITPCPQGDIITDLADVKASVQHAGVAIVDARDQEYYTGKTQPDGQRRGHIPGAGSLPFVNLWADDGRLKSADQLTALFHAAGVKPGDRVIVYCHIGQQASADYFAARTLGYDVRLYDGSWEEWSAHKELPAETSR
ncbi:MAG TPA: sulfurtransferase [Terriglobales bacterium]|jgi:thiosulfate/3-mercaptopyruvate sulfurtransferase|nr:sulfurtransferase [Terriglobales bacterium]